jgi:hypothetical protein
MLCSMIGHQSGVQLLVSLSNHVKLISEWVSVDIVLDIVQVHI